MYSNNIPILSVKVVNHHLLKDLTEKGLWSDVMKHEMIAANGSIQVGRGFWNSPELSILPYEDWLIGVTVGYLIWEEEWGVGNWLYYSQTSLFRSSNEFASNDSHTKGIWLDFEMAGTSN